MIIKKPLKNYSFYFLKNINDKKEWKFPHKNVFLRY